MLLFPDFIRLLLIACFFGMAVLALLYLRQRQLSLIGYCLWGLVATLLPFVGPFLVIMSQPGEKRQVLSSNKDTAHPGSVHQAQ